MTLHSIYQCNLCGYQHSKPHDIMEVGVVSDTHICERCVQSARNFLRFFELEIIKVDPIEYGHPMRALVVYRDQIINGEKDESEDV